jgi:hypothetical protein
MIMLTPKRLLHLGNWKIQLFTWATCYWHWHFMWLTWCEIIAVEAARSSFEAVPSDSVHKKDKMQVAPAWTKCFNGGISRCGRPNDYIKNSILGRSHHVASFQVIVIANKKRRLPRHTMLNFAGRNIGDFPCCCFCGYHWSQGPTGWKPPNRVEASYRSCRVVRWSSGKVRQSFYINSFSTVSNHGIVDWKQS